MEELDDDDFSDLYADVEVQASSAIRALYELTKMPPPGEIISDDATGGEKGKGCNFIGTEIARGNGEIYDRATVGEDRGGLTELPSQNGDTCDGGSVNEGSDGIKQKFRVTNTGENGADETKHVVIDGNEKSTNSRDNDYLRKNLKYDSSISKKRKVDDVADQVQKTRNNADADVSNDGDDCFSGASEDNNDGGDKVASERGLVDKYGSSQVSDSEGDNNHEVSDCDSDEMIEVTEISDAENRRNANSSSSDKVQSLAESESSESGWSHHSPRSSSPSSASAALSNEGTEKRRKHSKNTSSITRDCHPSNYSRSHTIKSSIEDGRYSQRQRGFIGKELNQHKKYNDLPNLKTYLTDEDDSYANYVKRRYNSHISHGKRREVLHFNSNEKDMPYCNQSESFSTDYGGVFPDYHLGPPYLKNQNWNIHPSYGYRAGLHDGHNMTGRQDFIEKRNSKMDYIKKRRHVIQGNTDESRKITPKYHSAVNARGTQFSNKGVEMHFKKTRRGYLSPLRDYNNDREGKSRRFMPSSDRHRGYPDHRYDQNIAHGLREMDDLRYGEAENNGRRPEFGFPVRNMRCSRKERHIECGHYGTKTATFDTRERLSYRLSENQHVRSRRYQQSTNTYITNGSIKDHHDQDHIFRRRHYEQTEALHSRDDTTLISEGPSYHYPKIARNNKPDDRHAFGRVAELIGERGVDRHRFKMMREEDSRNRFDGRHRFIEADKCVQMRQRYQYSVDSRLVVVDKKFTDMQSSRRTSEAGDDHFICGENDLEDLGYFNRENAAFTNERKVDTTNLSDKNWQDNFSKNPKDQFLDIEEGQIIGDEINNHSVKSVIVSQDNTEIASNSIAVVETLGEDKIQEIIAKMERRKERFKEHIITSSGNSEKSSNQSTNLAVETSEGKLGRPARKRKWF